MAIFSSETLGPAIFLSGGSLSIGIHEGMVIRLFSRMGQYSSLKNQRTVSIPVEADREMALCDAVT